MFLTMVFSSFVVECAKFCILSHINLIRASLDSRYDWWVLETHLTITPKISLTPQRPGMRKPVFRKPTTTTWEKSTLCPTSYTQRPWNSEEKRGGKMAKRYLLLKEKRWVEIPDLKSSIWKPDWWGSFRLCLSIRFCRSSSSSEDSFSISKSNAEMPKGLIQFQIMESEFMYVFRKSKRKVKRGGYGNLSYPSRPPRPAPPRLNF